MSDVSLEPHRNAASEPPRFAPPAGPIVGRVDRGVIRATGIPYARASRFGPPAPVPDHDGVFEATEWSPACPQEPNPFLEDVLGTGFGELEGSEDCQNLSITLPLDIRPDERLPVMVWIHGGSYVQGAGDVAIMDPRFLVIEQRVIVVSVTYRLGLFGYLGDAKGRPANLGLLDQVEAFRWVRRNIAAFGGDPDRVTAFGQSAGGDAVAHLMATPDASSLFSRAIIQSAPLGISRKRDRMNAAMSRAAEVVTGDMSWEEILEVQAAAEKSASRFGLLGGMPFGTQYGHTPLPDEKDVDEVWSAVAPRIDILIGHTSEEARLFAHRVPALDRMFRIPVLGRGLEAAMVAIATRAVYSWSNARFAKRHARAGGRAHSYVLSWSAPGNPYGSAHTIDLPMLFGDEATWKPASLLKGASWDDIRTSGEQVRRVWADFARGELGESGRIPNTLTYRRLP
ncbi:carboxylesterase family protein [Amnibacterium flavum]|uniref:carboxylesterase family protein n=1 Tax=Amnibacterium flavum TaxID=2173173 RepID=UPI001F0B8A0C|nr:carboxylesterase family protein [Amnibacterium flavum]